MAPLGMAESAAPIVDVLERTDFERSGSRRRAPSSPGTAWAARNEGIQLDGDLTIRGVSFTLPQQGGRAVLAEACSFLGEHYELEETRGNVMGVSSSDLANHPRARRRAKRRASGATGAVHDVDD